MRPEIAIVDANTLSCLGLQGLLQEVIPQATIRTFPSFAALMADTPDMYAHYFVSAQVYFEHTSFFRERRPKSIVLTMQDNLPQLSGIPTRNICQDEQHLAKSILQLRSHGHHGGGTLPDEEHDLSVREIEVLTLLVKGLIHKEIADRLNISLTTVITHRKNITEKLGIKSLSGLTIYAVMRGYVEADGI